MPWKKLPAGTLTEIVGVVGIGLWWVPVFSYWIF